MRYFRFWATVWCACLLFCAFAADAFADVAILEVISDNTLVYSQADATSDVVDVLKAGTKIVATGPQVDGFFEVTLPNGAKGYVAVKAARPMAPAAPAAPPVVVAPPAVETPPPPVAEPEIPAQEAPANQEAASQPAEEVPPPPAAVQPSAVNTGFCLGLDAGFNLFDISGKNDLKLKSQDGGDSASSDAKLTFDPSLAAAIVPGYMGRSYFIGGEIFLTSGSGRMAGTEFYDGDTLVYDMSSTKYDFAIFRIGPIYKYFFKKANPKSRPFIGGGLLYSSTTFETEGGHSGDQGDLVFSFMGGYMHRVSPKVWIGGSGRIDYLVTISPATLKDVPVDGVDMEMASTWVPLSLFFNVMFDF